MQKARVIISPRQNLFDRERGILIRLASKTPSPPWRRLTYAVLFARSHGIFVVFTAAAPRRRPTPEGHRHGIFVCLYRGRGDPSPTKALDGIARVAITSSSPLPRRHHIRDFGKQPQGRFSVSRVAQNVVSRAPPYGRGAPPRHLRMPLPRGVREAAPYDWMG